MGRFRLDVLPARKRHRAFRLLVNGSLIAGAIGASAAWATQLLATPEDTGVMSRVITRQKVEAAVAVAGEPPNEHQWDAYSPEQMMELATFYKPEIERAHERAQQARVIAAHGNDAIRLTCIDDKLLQMQTVIGIVEPRFFTLRMARHDDLRMRGQFAIIHQAWARMRELATDVETCLGDYVDFGVLSRAGDEIPVDKNGDPSRPAEAFGDVPVADRPPEASSYQ